MKLVRDRIPELYPHHAYRQALPGERVVFLKLKLAEEVGEVLSAPDAVSFLEEMADLYEVADSLLAAYGWGQSDVAGTREDKNLSRGSFNDGYVLVSGVI